jgi:hypothetical protein
MKKQTLPLIALIVIFAICSCQKQDLPQRMRCIYTVTTQMIGQQPVTNSFSEPKMLTDSEARYYESLFTTDAPGVILSNCGDTLGYYEKFCNCNPYVCQ